MDIKDLVSDKKRILVNFAYSPDYFNQFLANIKSINPPIEIFILARPDQVPFYKDSGFITGEFLHNINPTALLLGLGDLASQIKSDKGVKKVAKQLWNLFRSYVQMIGDIRSRFFDAYIVPKGVIRVKEFVLAKSFAWFFKSKTFAFVENDNSISLMKWQLVPFNIFLNLLLKIFRYLINFLGLTVTIALITLFFTIITIFKKRRLLR